MCIEYLQTESIWLKHELSGECYIIVVTKKW